jgi:hypothetical protein
LPNFYFEMSFQFSHFHCLSGILAKNWIQLFFRKRNSAESITYFISHWISFILNAVAAWLNNSKEFEIVWPKNHTIHHNFPWRWRVLSIEEESEISSVPELLQTAASACNLILKTDNFVCANAYTNKTKSNQFSLAISFSKMPQIYNMATLAS